MSLVGDAHATSKLGSLSDLRAGRVLTYGFRGEALHAIGTVSLLTLTSTASHTLPSTASHSSSHSSPQLQQTLSTVIRHGERVFCGVAREPRGVGTTVSLHDMFANRAVERNRLQRAGAAEAEAEAVRRALARLAVARPDVALRLHDGARGITTMSATRGEDARVRFLRLFGGGATPPPLLPLHFTDRTHRTEITCTQDTRGILSVRGYVSPPASGHRTREMQLLCVNSRPLHSSHALHKLVETACARVAAAVAIDDAPHARRAPSGNTNGAPTAGDSASASTAAATAAAASSASARTSQRACGRAPARRRHPVFFLSLECSPSLYDVVADGAHDSVSFIHTAPVARLLLDACAQCFAAHLSVGDAAAVHAAIRSVATTVRRGEGGGGEGGGEGGGGGGGADSGGGGGRGRQCDGERRQTVAHRGVHANAPQRGRETGAHADRSNRESLQNVRGCGSGGIGGGGGVQGGGGGGGGGIGGCVGGGGGGAHGGGAGSGAGGDGVGVGDDGDGDGSFAAPSLRVSASARASNRALRNARASTVLGVHPALGGGAASRRRADGCADADARAATHAGAHAGVQGAHAGLHAGTHRRSCCSARVHTHATDARRAHSELASPLAELRPGLVQHRNPNGVNGSSAGGGNRACEIAAEVARPADAALPCALDPFDESEWTQVLELAAQSDWDAARPAAASKDAAANAAGDGDGDGDGDSDSDSDGDGDGGGGGDGDSDGAGDVATNGAQAHAQLQAQPHVQARADGTGDADADATQPFSAATLIGSAPTFATASAAAAISSATIISAQCAPHIAAAAPSAQQTAAEPSSKLPQAALASKAPHASDAPRVPEIPQVPQVLRIPTSSTDPMFEFDAAAALPDMLGLSEPAYSRKRKRTKTLAENEVSTMFAATFDDSTLPKLPRMAKQLSDTQLSLRSPVLADASAKSEDTRALALAETDALSGSSLDAVEAAPTAALSSAIDWRQALAAQPPLFAPKGGAGLVSPACEMRISKDEIKMLVSLGQVSRRFIIAKSVDVGATTLFAVDQHAADERVQLERLTAATVTARGLPVDGAVGVRQRAPHRLALSEREVAMLRACLTKLTRWGWDLRIERDGAALVTEPVVLGVALGVKAMLEYAEAIDKAGGGTSQPPPAVLRVLASKACRRSIMFGDLLTPACCQELLHQLGKCELPFQCAHGRPTVAPLVCVSRVREAY